MAHYCCYFRAKGVLVRQPPARPSPLVWPEGKKTVVIDFDIGLRNLDLIMGCERRVVYDFVNVIQGDATLNQALIKISVLKISIFFRHRKLAVRCPHP